MKLSLSCRSAIPLVLGAIIAAGTNPLAGQVNTAPQEDVTNVFLPAPRGLRQQLNKARKALEEQQFSEAVDLLGQLLASNDANASEADNGGGQDYFLSGPDELGTQVSLKSEAQRLLGGMPEKGRALYELKFGTDARQLLDQAMQAQDMRQLVEVTRSYFHTDAGYEATMLIGRFYLDQGRPLAAALRFQRLEGSEYATRRYDPELTLLLATCWMLADMPERARQSLLMLESRAPESSWRFGDREVALFDPADKTLAEAVLAVPGTSTAPPQGIDRILHWLQYIIGPEISSRNEAKQWTMFRGDAARNAESAGGTPLLSARWRVQTANHPTDEEMIRQGRKQYLEQGVPAIPTLNPLAVENVIVMRSPRRLIGVDFETGKRLWEFPWFEAPDEEVLQSDRILPTQQLQHPQLLELSRRIWDDAPYGQMSSDGRQVFMLWGLAAGTSQSPVLVQPFGVQRPNQAGSMDTNKLVALDLKAQGKLRWIVGDEDGTDEPKLAGAFFLGAPLPLMGQLFVLAELNGEIRLVVLNAETGALDWSQQLAHVDARSILIDPGRRAAGATPSFSDGVIVCPTSSGAVVAVDVSSRSLLWGYQYPLVGPTTRITMAQYRNSEKAIGDRWADATITVCDGRVLVTPVESDQLYCLDLLSGKLVWDPLERGDMLYTACAFQGNAIMVGKQGLTAISLQDGKIQWTCELPGGLPSGRGMLTAGHYYLPTTSNRLFKIDLTNGKIDEDIETDSTLGNLVAYRDQVVSLNVDWLAAYYQTDPLRKVVAKRLADNANDGWALARKAELLLHDGEHGQALETFQLAYKLNPEDDAIRSSLVRALLSALRNDFRANQRFSTELESLINEPEELANYCRWMAVGMKQLGNFEKATEYFIRLASMENSGEFGSVSDGDSEMMRLDNQLQVHRSRWLSVQIQQMLAAVQDPARESVDRMIRAHLDEVTQSNSISKLKQYVEHFGSHPAGTEARLQLARLLLDRGHLLHAELELIELETAEDPAIATSATALLAQMLINNGKLEEAMMCIQRLTDQWGDVADQDGQTGKQLAAAAMENDTLRKWFDERSRWPYGKCETAQQDRRAVSSYSRVFPIEMDEFRGPFPRNHTIVYNQNQNSLVMSNSQGKVTQQVLLGTQNRFVATSNAAGSASANGHLLVVNVGFEVMAIDTLRSASQQGEVVLWRNDLSANLMTAANRTRQMMPKTITRKWGPARIVNTDTSRSLVGMAGPITRQGVVYQKIQDITCVDPLTGETIWVRSGIEQGSDIFGDEDYTFVVGPESSEALVLNSADGTELGRRQVTSRTERWITYGRNVVTCRADGKQLTVRCFDAWGQQDLWSRTLNNDTQCWRPSRDEVAMFEPKGKLLILNLISGETTVECQLQAEPTLDRLFVLAAQDSYTVVTSGKRPNTSATYMRLYGLVGGDLCPEINGHVYSIDRQTGKPRWPAAATVYDYCLPLDQAPDSPTIVFLQNTTSKAADNSPRTEYKAAVVILDKRDGRELLSAGELERILNYSIESDPEAQTILVKTNAHEFQLKFTDEPIEAAKPFQMKLKDSTSSKVFQSVGKIAGAVLEAITEKGKEEAQKKVEPAPKVAPKDPEKPEKNE